MSEMRVWAVCYDNPVWDSLGVHLPWGSYSWPSKQGLPSALSQKALVSLCLPVAPITHSDTHVIHVSTVMASRGGGGSKDGALLLRPPHLGLIPVGLLRIAEGAQEGGSCFEC